MATELLTYQDAYEHLADVHDLIGKTGEDRVPRMIRRAITEAYRKLPSIHDWIYFRRIGTLVTEVPYDTGTIEFTLSTRQMTLTGGTWPANAAFGSVLIGEEIFAVKRRVSDTIVEIDSTQLPTDDIAALTTYQWSRYRYLLPVDVGDIVDLVDTVQTFRLHRVDQAEIFYRQLLVDSNSFPSAWSMIRSPDYPGRWEIWIGSAPTSARSFRYFYNARQTTLGIQELSTETSSFTVDITDDTATFSSATLTDDCVGAVLRVATDANSPTNRIGKYIDNDTGSVVRLPDFERQIVSVTNSTTAVLSLPITTPVTTRGFTISSLVDVNLDGMWEYFLRLCELQYDILQRADTKVIATSKHMAQEALIEAAGMDSRNPQRTEYRGTDYIIVGDGGLGA